MNEAEKRSVAVFTEWETKLLFSCFTVLLKSVRVHFAYRRFALLLELLGQFGRFLEENDHCNPPVLLILSRLLGL